MKRNYINLITILAIGVLIVMVVNPQKKKDSMPKARTSRKFAAARAEFSRKPTKIALVGSTVFKEKFVVFEFDKRRRIRLSRRSRNHQFEAGTPEKSERLFWKNANRFKKASIGQPKIRRANFPQLLWIAK